MSPAWSVEWSVALRRRRLFALNVVVPLALVAPVALGGAPAGHAAAVYAVLFVLFGVFGSAIPWVRDGGSGLLSRWIVAGLHPRELVGARLAAQALLDLLQTLPALALVILVAGGSARGAAAAVAALSVALLVANALGVWVAAAARSLAEAALFAAVAALLLLHGAGVFRTPRPGSAGAATELVSPFRLLHEVLLALQGPGGGTLSSWAPALVAGAAFLGLTALAAPFLAGVLGRSEDG